MNKIIRMRMTAVNPTTGNGMIRSRNGQAINVTLSDKVLHYGIDEGDIATIRIIDGDYVVTDFEKPIDSSENDEYSWADEELIGEY